MAVTVQLGFKAQYFGLTEDTPSSLGFLWNSPRRLNLEPYLRINCRKWEGKFRRRPSLKVSCERGSAIVEKDETTMENGDGNEKQLSIVMKFGGSSLASAERMREVADLILSFPEERPIIVLSAMGKTTNKLLLAGEKAVCCGVSNTSDIEELSFTKELHLNTVKELGLDVSIIAAVERHCYDERVDPSYQRPPSFIWGTYAY